MPELPEVETIVAEMRTRLHGDVITHATLARPDYLRTPTPDFAAAVAHRRIIDISREGKRIWLSLSKAGANARSTAIDARCRLHLGMSGRITFEPPAAPAAPHTHLRVGFRRQACELRMRDPRRFGGIWWYNGHEAGSALEKTPGIDALAVRARDLDAVIALHRRAKASMQPTPRRMRAIKALLLDQNAIAGMGNIYCDEALFAARIHPACPAGRLTSAELRRLATEIRAVLRRAIRHGGSTLRDYVRADGTGGAFQNLHRVYGREDDPCPACGTPIARIVLASRSTHFCPNCQVLPR